MGDILITDFDAIFFYYGDEKSDVPEYYGSEGVYKIYFSLPLCPWKTNRSFLPFIICVRDFNG